MAESPVTPTPDTPCDGSFSIDIVTAGIADGRSECPHCGQRVRIIPAAKGTRFTRQSDPRIDYHFPKVRRCRQCGGPLSEARAALGLTLCSGACHRARREGAS